MSSTTKRSETATVDASRRRALLASLATTTVYVTAGCLSGEQTDDTSPAGDPGVDSPASYADDASVSFVTPTDGQTVRGGVSVVMQAENVELEPAGQPRDGAGHFHLIVDGDPTAAGEIIPADETHFHYGDASTATVLDLSPGEHRLVLQLGDGNHRATDLTDEVTVRVEDDAIATFTEPEDGATVTSPVHFAWETENFALEPAGEIRQNSGHAVLLVDNDPVQVGKQIPDDEGHIHFDDGETETTLDLEPGEHRIVLQVGNGQHLATPLVDEITVTVEAADDTGENTTTNEPTTATRSVHRP
ncbi:DUF4399 domain-containing protein [Haloarchaeobius sp. DFWS5]|uniref:DUF4399 domain-containing protein n=1 Tax=Haloarchaeobius sp. DFWS5 TaxID=3446114 RepID=UPI003EBBAF2D